MLDMEEHGEQAGPGPSSGGGSEGGRRKSSLRIGCALLPKKVRISFNVFGGSARLKCSVPSWASWTTPGCEPKPERGRCFAHICYFTWQVARYLTPAMKHAAAARGIELCLIDYARPLSEQGSFDGIIHKLRPNKGRLCRVRGSQSEVAQIDAGVPCCVLAEWERDLLEYSKQHPEVTVIDRVDGIRTLQNRSTMLSPLHGDGILVKVGASCSPAPARNAVPHCQSGPGSAAQLGGHALLFPRCDAQHA